MADRQFDLKWHGTRYMGVIIELILECPRAFRKLRNLGANPALVVVDHTINEFAKARYAVLAGKFLNTLDTDLVRRHLRPQVRRSILGEAHVQEDEGK